MPIRLLQADRLIRNARIIIPVGFGLVLAAALAVALLLKLARDADTEVIPTFEVQRAARNLLISVVDAETGQRGFLLTSNASYLQPFERAEGAFRGQLDTLSEIAAKDKEQHDRALRLRPLVSAKFEELSRTIRLAQDGRRDEALAVVDSDAGLNLMKDVRAELYSILDTERDLLEERQSRASLLRYVLAGLIGRNASRGDRSRRPPRDLVPACREGLGPTHARTRGRIEASP